MICFHMKLRKATVVWVPAKSQSAFEGGAPAESCYLALLRVGKLSLKQAQLGQSKLDSPLGTDNQKESDFFIHYTFRLSGIKGSQNILNIKLQSVFEGGKPAAESEQQ